MGARACRETDEVSTVRNWEMICRGAILIRYTKKGKTPLSYRITLFYGIDIRIRGTHRPPRRRGAET